MKLDITVVRKPIDGTLLLSCVYNQHLVRRAYYGYTKREALRLFRAYLKKQT